MGHLLLTHNLSLAPLSLLGLTDVLLAVDETDPDLGQLMRIPTKPGGSHGAAGS